MKPDNHLLAQLEPAIFDRISPHLEKMDFRSGDILHHAEDELRYVYFPGTNTIISMIAVESSGSTVEAGLVGHEGYVMLAPLIDIHGVNLQMLVQHTGSGYRIRSEILRNEFDKEKTLRNILLRYSHAFTTSVSQGSLCNRLHTLEERLSKWLLHSQDRLKTQELGLTQEFLSTMLGVSRATVSLAASILQKAGFIEYQRGKIRILDRESLEGCSCECYEIIRRHYELSMG